MSFKLQNKCSLCSKLLALLILISEMGKCPDPSCSFEYKYRPYKCPLCDSFIGQILSNFIQILHFWSLVILIQGVSANIFLSKHPLAVSHYLSHGFCSESEDVEGNSYNSIYMGIVIILFICDLDKSVIEQVAKKNL